MTKHADDFDFMFGTWQVSHRRLRDRLCGGTTWDAFTGTSRTFPILQGHGNVEDNVVDLPGDPYSAIALRSFDPATGLWAIWWLDGRSPHTLDVPVTGRFEADRGTFTARDHWQGRPIIVRFTWIRQDVPRWEQAFSDDDGASWETNWTMDFHRTSGA